jgi:hypothetical protein
MNQCNILFGKHEGKRPVGSSGADENIILKWLLRKVDVRLWTAVMLVRIGSGDGLW